MNKNAFKDAFNSITPVVLPVIHVLDNEQAVKNVAIAQSAGCPGVFLINHDFPYEQFLPIITHVRQQFPDFWLGVNFLAVTGLVAFPVLADLAAGGTRVDAYWADDARINEAKPPESQEEAANILAMKASCGWKGLYFGGTAFKKQREVHAADYTKCAAIARNFMDVVTTSGIATGHAADTGKIQTFRTACDDTPLALASGITPENFSDYRHLVDAVLVATGINFTDDFYNIDPSKLATLLNLCKPEAMEEQT